jgi:predicted nucleotidyltransferase
MTQSEADVLAKFKRILSEKLGDSDLELRLFGSKARGDDRVDSDVDVLVIVSDGFWKIIDKVYDVATDLMLETGICLSPKVLSRQQYMQMREANAPFLLNVIQEGLVL